MEVPKGVTVTLGGALFDPGDGLESIFTDDVWTIFSNLTVKLKP